MLRPKDLLKPAGDFPDDMERKDLLKELKQKPPLTTIIIRAMIYKDALPNRIPVDLPLAIFRKILESQSSDKAPNGLERILQLLSEHPDMQARFYPENYLVCKPHIRTFSELFKLCTLLKWPHPKRNKQNPLYEPLKGFEEVMEYLHDKIAPFFPATMSDDMLQYLNGCYHVYNSHHKTSSKPSKNVDPWAGIKKQRVIDNLQLATPL